MDGMLWGPGAQAELAYRRERIEQLRGAGARDARRASRAVGGAARHRRAGRASRTTPPVAGPARGWALPGSGAWPAA